MNAQCYKVIFNKRLGRLVAVGEHAATQGQAGSGAQPTIHPTHDGHTHKAAYGYKGGLQAVFAAGLLSFGGGAWGLDASALPTGAAVQAGSVVHSVNDAGNVMNIVQTTHRAVVNYDTFNIGHQATVNHSGGVLLGRVTGAGASRIEGTLTTSGMVLVNPSGIAIGSTANIHAGSFTASTFNISNDDFMAGRLRFERNGTEAGVVNEGTITTEGGGYVALVGATVDNHGRIATAGGDVVLASGQTATLSVPLSASGRVRLELDAGALNAAVAHHKSGVIVTEGGQVLMRAAALVDATSNMAPATVTHMGQIDTTGEQGGRVDILADHGVVRVGGSVTANSTDGTAGGDIYMGRDEQTHVLAAVGDASGASLESIGGFVETSGQFLKVDGARVIAKDWLLDPFNITIVGVGTTTAGATGLPDYTPNASSTILAFDITTHLNDGTNVTISTAGAGNDEGNITVNADIVTTSTGTASLTLIADNNITVNNKIAAEGDATGLNVTLRAGQTTNTGFISIAAGGIAAKAGHVILQTSGGAISNGLGVGIVGNNVTVDNTGGAINATTGAITAGNGSASLDTRAIMLNGNLTATGNLHMYGRAINNNGITVDNGRVLSGGFISAVGETTSNNGGYGFFVGNRTQIRTTGSSGNSVIKGTRLMSTAGGQGALQTQEALLIAASGTSLTLEGHATGPGIAANLTNSRGIRIDDSLRTQGDIRLLGTSVGNDGVLIIAPVAVEAGSLNINGTMTALGGGGRSGVRLTESNNITLSHGTSLTMVGHAANTGTATIAEEGVTLAGSILQAAGATAGDISITGSATSTPDSFGVIVNGSITTSGNIHIQSVVGHTEQKAVSTITTSGVGATINIDSAQSLVAAGTIGIDGTGNLFAHSSAGTINIANAAVTGNMAATAAGNISIVNTGATKFSARTTANNGSITLVNSGGTLDVAAVNGLTGVVTHGSGNIALTSSSTSGYGMILRNSVTAANGNVTLSGSTSTTQTQDIPFAGVYGFSSVTGNNITLSANATGASGTVLGYYGAGGVFEAKGSLSLTGTSNNTGNGLYTFGGRYASATGMTLVGTSASGQGMNFDRNLVIVNGSSGGIDISASAGGATQNAISMRGVSITNGGGDITLDATQGHIFADSGNLDWRLGALSNTIQQSGTGQVRLTTVGDGNITVPTIVNNSAGQVVIAAGSNLAAGTASGGQVLTVSGNAITQNSGGKTFIYSGQASGTGQLSFLRQSFNQLVSNGTSLPINTQFNTAYAATIASGPDHQVLFRSATGPSFTLGLNHVSATYGDAERNQAALNSALLSAYTGPSLLSTVATGANGGVNTFAVTASDVIAGLTGTARAAGNNAGTYAYTNVSASAFNTVLSAQPNLVINPRSIALTSLTSAEKIYDGNTVATINGATFSGLLTGETLSISGFGSFNSANVADVDTVTVNNANQLHKVDGTGLWNNYNLLTTNFTSAATGKITPAPLTISANDTSIFVTQRADTAIQQGMSYTGFVNGETPSGLSGVATVTYHGETDYPAAGTYSGVYRFATQPTSSNYDIRFVEGNLVVTPADRLMITIQSQEALYGSQTPVNIGQAAAGTVTAQYCLNPADCNGSNLYQLGMEQLTPTRWKATDITGSFVVFDTSVANPTFSTGGYVNVGNYAFSTSDISPNTLSTDGVTNFTNRVTNAGVLSVQARTLTYTAIDEVTEPNGTLQTQTLHMQGLLAGDAVNVVGQASGTTAGVYQSLLRLNDTNPGADRANYRMVFVNGTLRIGSNAARQPQPQRGTQLAFVANIHEPNTQTDEASQATASVSGSSTNPFALASGSAPDVQEPRCNLDTLEHCRCDVAVNDVNVRVEEDMMVCYSTASL